MLRIVFGACLALLVALTPVAARAAGLVEMLVGADKLKEIGIPALGQPIIDPRFEPVGVLRLSYTNTFINTPRVGNAVYARDAPATYFGNRHGFVIENVELGAKGRFESIGLYYSFKFELVNREKNGEPGTDYMREMLIGWNGWKVNLGERWGTWRPLDLRAGRFRMPLSAASFKSNADLTLANRSFLDFFTPKQQVGVQVQINAPGDIAAGKFGLFNSVRLPEQQMNNFRQLLFVARGELRLDRILAVAGAEWKGFYLLGGVNWAYTRRDFDLGLQQQWFGIDGRAVLPLFRHMVRGVDRTWRLQLEGEFLQRGYEIAGGGEGGKNRIVQGFGWMAEATLDLLPGVLDTAVRYEWMDGIRDEVTGTTFVADSFLPQRKAWTTFGLTFYPIDRIKLQVNYIMRRELEGNRFNNDVLIGFFSFQL